MAEKIDRPICIRLDTTWQRDGRTEGQKWQYNIALCLQPPQYASVHYKWLSGEQPPRAARWPWPLTFWPWNWCGMSAVACQWQLSCQFRRFCDLVELWANVPQMKSPRVGDAIHRTLSVLPNLKFVSILFPKIWLIFGHVVKWPGDDLSTSTWGYGSPVSWNSFLWIFSLLCPSILD